MPGNCYFVSILAAKHSPPFSPIHTYEITIAFLSLLVYLDHIMVSGRTAAFNQ